jgi:hypothetical protein
LNPNDVTSKKHMTLADMSCNSSIVLDRGTKPLMNVMMLIILLLFCITIYMYIYVMTLMNYVERYQREKEWTREKGKLLHKRRRRRRKKEKKKKKKKKGS